MTPLIFRVQGSAAEPYTVTFSRDGDNLTAHCTCPAGGTGMQCKHRIGLLTGEPVDIVSDNAADAAQLVAWLKGTDVELALMALREAETQLEAAKRLVTDRKKTLARLLAN